MRFNRCSDRRDQNELKTIKLVRVRPFVLYARECNDTCNDVIIYYKRFQRVVRVIRHKFTPRPYENT